MNLKTVLKNELIAGKSCFDWAWLAIGCLVQIIGVMYGYMTGNPDGLVSIICAFSGVFSVIFAAQGKISAYVFFYIQVCTYMVIAFQSKLWGEFYENIFYFITQTIGVFVWYKNYKQKTENKSTEVVAKKLNKIGWVITSAYLVIGTIILTIVLSKTSDALPFMDAISTIPAFSAQILMVLGYREQWLHWIILDIASVIMFAIIGNWMMVAMFVFWTLNCVYGWYKWNKSANYNNWKEIKE